jgi:hypothetical protein
LLVTLTGLEKSQGWHPHLLPNDIIRNISSDGLWRVCVRKPCSMM